MEACAEKTRLNWIYNNQKNLRANVYNGLTNAFANDHINFVEQNHQIVFFATFINSEWFMQNLYHNVMIIVRGLKKPHFFIIFFINSKWFEVHRKLKSKQQINDWLNLIVRVFQMKVSRVAVGVWKPLVIFMYLEINFARKFMQWRNLYAHMNEI